MKFKFEKLTVGSEVILTDARGNTARAKVTDLQPARARVFIIRFSETAELFVHQDATTVLYFCKGCVAACYTDGCFYEGYPEGLRVTEIKRPWKEFTGELRHGMKVRTQVGDKYVKGTVHELGAQFKVEFEQEIEFRPGLFVKSIYYYRSGDIIGPLDKSELLHTFRITHFK